jgi:predicted lipoprotein with Yx(FWY)xxD motif
MNFKHALLGSLTLTLLFTGCNEEDDKKTDTKPVLQTEAPKTDAPKVDTQEEQRAASILSTQTRTSHYLVDNNENALYTFDKDTLDASNCDEACQAIWPKFTTATSDDNIATLTADPNQAGFIKHPLYTFASDTSGATNGDWIKDVWHVIYPQSAFTDNTNVKRSTGTKKQTFLTAKDGKALYTFDKDEADISNCVDACITTWPAYWANLADFTVPNGMDKTLFATIERSDGTKQTTYNHKPLYYFAPDTDSTPKGDWVKGIWHLVELKPQDNAVTPSDVVVETPKETQSITFGASGTADYTFNATSDESIASVGSNDPEIKLTVGTRYSVTFPSGHPLAFRAGSTTLLDKNGAGSFASDSDVNLVATSSNLEFTLTQTLADQLNNYVCQFHGSMEGVISTK